MKDKPKWIIWENVKGVLDRNMRDSFFIYLKELESLGYESKYVRILSSKLLKAKEQVKSKDKDKKSILGQIKSFKTDDKTKSNKKDHSKGAER